MGKKNYSLYKRGQIWYVGVMVNGKQKCFSTGCKDRDRAIRWVELDFGAIKGYSYHDILNHYLTENPHRSEVTVKYAKYFIERFAIYLNKFGMDANIADASTWKIKKYMNWLMLNVNPTSVKIEMGAIRAVFLSAYRAGMLHENPFAGVKLPKANSKLLFLSSEDIMALLKVADDNPLYKNYIKFLLYTGCRGGEFRNLRWADIHSDFLEFVGKSGRRRFPLNEDIKGILNNIKSFSIKPLKEYVLIDYRNGEWIGAHSQLGKIVKKYLRKARLDERYTTHTLRHTYASHLVMEGNDLFTVSKLLGHKSVKMTEKYAHLQPELLKTRVKY